MGKLRNFLFPTKENSVYETTTIHENNQDSNQKNSSAVLINTPNQEIQIKKETAIINETKENVKNTPLQIYKPARFEEVEDLANELLNNHSIIVSLLEIEKNEARRICDFLNGVCFALNGEVKKIEKRVYLFSPNTK